MRAEEPFSTRLGCFRGDETGDVESRRGLCHVLEVSRQLRGREGDGKRSGSASRRKRSTRCARAVSECRRKKELFLNALRVGVGARARRSRKFSRREQRLARKLVTERRARAASASPGRKLRGSRIRHPVELIVVRSIES